MIINCKIYILERSLNKKELKALGILVLKDSEFYKNM